MAIAAETLLVAVLFLDQLSLRRGVLEWLAGLAQMALLIGVIWAVPLGLLGGIVALWTLRYRPGFPPKRWPSRGAVVGGVIGAVGSAVSMVPGGELSIAALYALLGGVAGSLAGAATGVALKHQLPGTASSAPVPTAQEREAGA